MVNELHGIRDSAPSLIYEAVISVSTRIGAARIQL